MILFFSCHHQQAGLEIITMRVFAPDSAGCPGMNMNYTMNDFDAFAAGNSVRRDDTDLRRLEPDGTAVQT